MDREGLVSELLESADTIKELTIEMQRLEQKRRQLGIEYEEIEYHQYDAIWSDVDEKGKPRFSNEERRSKELAHRLRQDAEALGLRQKIYEARDEIEELAAESNRLRDRRIALLVALGAPLPSDSLGSEEGGKYPGY